MVFKNKGMLAAHFVIAYQFTRVRRELLQGTTYVLEYFFLPYVVKHEPEIDRSLIALRTRALDIVVHFSKSILSNSQTSFFEMLHYVIYRSSKKIIIL